MAQLTMDTACRKRRLNARRYADSTHIPALSSLSEQVYANNDTYPPSPWNCIMPPLRHKASFVDILMPDVQPLESFDFYSRGGGWTDNAVPIASIHLLRIYDFTNQFLG